MSVSAKLFMKLVSKNCTDKATISTICASVNPAWRTAASCASATLPSVSINLFAKRIAVSRLASVERRRRLRAISSCDNGKGRCKITVGRQTVAAAVHFREGQSHAFAHLRAQRTAERTLKTDERGQRRRADRHEGADAG